MARLGLHPQPKTRRSNSRLGAVATSAPLEPLVEVAPSAWRAFPWSKIPALLLLGLSVWMLYSLINGPRFRVHSVRVLGTRMIQTAEVQRFLNLLDVSIFQVQTYGLEQSLAREFGCIAEVRVACQLPDEVSVTLREHEIAAIWESGGKLWWLGQEGQVLGQAREVGELVVIHDTSAHAPNPRERIPGLPWPLIQGMIKALPAAKSYDFAPDQGLILQVTGAKWPVYLGDRGDAGAKVAILQALVGQLMAKGINVEYIDLRNEQRPVYKKR
jgi:cell division septal protein FtsQ